MDSLGISSRFAGGAPIGNAVKPHGGDAASMRQTAEQFESMFLSQMLQPMFSDLTAEEPFGGGMAEEFWRSFEVEEFGKALTRAGGIGIADQVYRQMQAMQAGKQQGGEIA